MVPRRGPACTSKPPSLSFPRVTGANPSLFARSATGAIASSSSLDKKDDAMASLNNRIGSPRSRTQVVKTFHDLSAGEGLRNEGGGREAVQFLRWQRKRIHCVDDRLALPTRQRLRNLTMFSERDCQDDRVGIERIRQRLGATVTLILLQAKAWARAWPIFPNPTIV